MPTADDILLERPETCRVASEAILARPETRPDEIEACETTRRYIGRVRIACDRTYIAHEYDRDQ